MGSCVITKKKLDDLKKAEPFMKMNDLVYKLIKDAILDAEFMPGEKLQVTGIADELDVSVTPVRNALKKLVDEQLVVEDVMNKRYYVFDISDRELGEIFDTRKMFEGAASAICAQRCSVIDTDTLEHLAEQFRDLWIASIGEKSDRENMTKRAAADSAFHDLIIRSTDNHFMIDYYRDLSQAQSHSLFRSMGFWDGDSEMNKRILAGQHISIVRAIESGQPDAARKTAEEHMDFCKFRCLMNRKHLKR
ncbi:MAG: GntR family transcriptional regulator [Anaerovoracaceae bacterium]